MPPEAQTKHRLYEKDLGFSYKPYLPILGSGLVTANGMLWQKQRVLIGPALRLDILVPPRPPPSSHCPSPPPRDIRAFPCTTPQEAATSSRDSPPCISSLLQNVHSATTRMCAVICGQGRSASTVPGCPVAAGRCGAHCDAGG